MPTRPIISLTTDFGLSDPFVGVMKGVIAGICPSANVIDVTHAVAAFDLLDGALAIWQAWRYFPAETVHVVVVDPGVGSERKPALSRMGGHWFIAPDNGVLTLVERDIKRAGGVALHRIIENPQYMLPAHSHTFHGRDIFAPAAAHLAQQMVRNQVAAETFGPTVETLIQLPIPEPIGNTYGTIEGVVLKADRFGNLLTNIPETLLPRDLQQCSIEIEGLRITRFFRFYAEAAEEKYPEVFAIVGSSGLLEFSVCRSSAKEQLGIAAGTRFRLLPN